MGDTGQRFAQLKRMLLDAGMRPTPDTTPARPRLRDLGALAGDVERVYRELGGQLPGSKLLPGPWDLSMDEVMIELDEGQHFNRYRAMTLDPDWSAALPWHSDYERYCDEQEHECLRVASHQGFWTNQSTELMFGPPGERADLSGRGSPRWRQRAVYDAMRDAYALEHATKMARVCVHDDVDGHRLENVLGGRATVPSHAVRELVERRTLTH